MSTLRCVVKPGVIEKLSDVYRVLAVQAICENDKTVNCPGILADSQKGEYGAFSYCNDTVRYSWAANKYWQRHGDAGCDLNSTVSLRDPGPAPEPSCASLLQQAGNDGENTVTPVSLSTAIHTSGNSNNNNPTRSMSRGEKAGIGVGISVLVALVLGALLFILHRAMVAKTNVKRNHDHSHKPELDNNEMVGKISYHEASAIEETIELPAEERAVEVQDLSGLSEAVELPAKERPVEIDTKIASDSTNTWGLRVPVKDQVRRQTPLDEREPL